MEFARIFGCVLDASASCSSKAFEFALVKGRNFVRTDKYGNAGFAAAVASTDLYKVVQSTLADHAFASKRGRHDSNVAGSSAKAFLFKDFSRNRRMAPTCFGI